MSSLTPVITKLEDLFTLFNEKYYNGELEKPIIAVSPDMTSGAFGWITCWRAWKEDICDHDGYYEINVCAEHLNRPFEEVVATLLHEMAHLYGLQYGIKDTSRGNSYHNKKFKEIAEAHGLSIEKDDKYGWTLTELNKECVEFVELMEVTNFTIHRTNPAKSTTTKKSSSRKYVCPDCGIIVRATKEVRIICSDCDTELELE